MSDFMKRPMGFVAALLGVSALTLGSVLYLMEMADALPSWVPRTPATHWVLATLAFGLTVVAVGVIFNQTRERALGPR